MSICNTNSNNNKNAKNKGQFFTVSECLQQKVFDLVSYKNERLLEPSFGKGHLLKKFLESDPNYPVDCCELDQSLVPCVQFSDAQTCLYGDFLELGGNDGNEELQEKYRTIIGNPPYVKTRSGCNLYLQFIRKCWEMLEDGGELVFIVPSDFIKLTSASKLITLMTNSGSFTHFSFPNNEKLFDGAFIDVVIFRYELGLLTNQVVVNDSPRICRVANGIITFLTNEQNEQNSQRDRVKNMSELFNIHVGFVSGKEEAFNVSYGNVVVLNDENRLDRYILVNQYPSEDQAINAQLLKWKDSLIKRRIRKFHEGNWFEWGALRNKKAINENMGKACIYVRTITRKEKVAFIGEVQYFGGGLLCMIPKAGGGGGENGEIDLQHIVNVLNNEDTKQNYTYSGRFKIGQKQLANVEIALA